MSVPISPPAPPTFSTTTGTCNCVDSCTAIMRPTTSLLPPGGNGITRRIGFEGYAWAAAGNGAMNRPIAIHANADRRMRIIGAVYFSHVRPAGRPPENRPPARLPRGVGTPRRPRRLLPADGRVRHDRDVG